MLEALASLLVLFIVLCGLSVVVSPMMGRHLDPFFLSRPVGRWAIRLPARTCRGTSRIFNRWSRQAWLHGNRTQSLFLKIFLYLSSATLGTIGLLLTIPAELLGDLPKL